MRNSIQGPLLRTGHNSSFKALGETGYPVFKMAFQLRETIYRLDAGRNLARHLAIPQNDQGGDRTDWYSSFSGDVIPWSGANETERESARQQFTEFQMAVLSLSEQLLNAEQSGNGGDRRVFAQLLKSVVHFPDYEFVYLVNGVLVITFWGFVHPEGEIRNPIHWLAPSSVPAAALAATPAPEQKEENIAPATTPVVNNPRQTRRWCWNWRWLLWLLLALLLLALLLGLLRGCTSSHSVSGLPVIPTSTEKTTAVPDTVTESPTVAPSAVATQADQAVSETAISSHAVSNAVQDSVIDEHQSPEPGQKDNTISPGSAQPVDPTDIPAADTAPGDTASSATTDNNGSNTMPPQPTVNEASADPASNPGSPDAQDSTEAPISPTTVSPVAVTPVNSAQGKPLTFPPTLPDGPAQFLNGQWRVNGGIQDKLTGRPLQLQYNFSQGTGTVSIHQSSGVTCNGPASGNMQQGALSITNPQQMKCSDGSNFIVPTIKCKSPAAGHADCFGSNDGEKTFPIRMLQPNS